MPGPAGTSRGRGDATFPRCEGERSRSVAVPAEWLTQSDGFVPKERYVSPTFLAAEHDRLWSRSGRSRAARRRSRTRATSWSTRSATSRCSSPATTTARSAPSPTCACTGARAWPPAVATRPTVRCGARSTAGATRSTGAASRSSTPRTSPRSHPTCGSRRCGAETWGGFVFVNFDPDAEPLLDFLDPLARGARPVPPRADAVAVGVDHGAPRQLESRGRRLQRGVPRAGRAPSDPALHRRHVDSLRAPREACALRTTPRPASGASSQPAPRRQEIEYDEGEMLARHGRRPRRGVPRRGARPGRRLARPWAGARPDPARDL